MLKPSIELPRVFESSNPRLIYGFVTLVKVFAAVDDEFLSAWRDDQPAGVGEGPNDPITHSTSGMSLTRLLCYNDDGPGALSLSEMDETQRLDILMTRQWLRALVWQLRLRHGGRHFSGSTASSSENQPPFQTARGILGIISAANRSSLEAHGIGMVKEHHWLAVNP